MMNDTISRQAALDALGDEPLAWTESEYELGLRNQWKSDVDAIKALSSTEPEQKIGYWDEDGCCSECGGDPMDFIDSMDAYIEKPMLYCPHCGAKMKGKVDFLDYIHKPIKERLKDREALLAKRSALERGKDD